MDTKFFPGIKLPGRGVDHPPTPSAKVKERVELYIYPLWAFVACSRVNFAFTFTFNFTFTATRTTNIINANLS
jgi:hypothetical protein